MSRESTTSPSVRTLVKFVLVIVGLFVLIELIEGLVGYSGLERIQLAVVDALLAGTLPGFLLAGGIGVLAGAVGVLGVLWVLGRI